MSHTEHAQYSHWSSYKRKHTQELPVGSLSFLNSTVSWACSGLFRVRSACSGVCPSLECFSLWKVYVLTLQWHSSAQGQPCLGNDSHALICRLRRPFLHGFTSWVCCLRLLMQNGWGRRPWRPLSLSCWSWVFPKKEDSHSYLNHWYSPGIPREARSRLYTQQIFINKRVNSFRLTKEF